MIEAKHSKRDAKKEKISRKQDAFYFTKREAQLQIKNLQTDEKCENFTVDPIYKKAIKWWSRLDEKYFITLTKESIALMRENTTSEKILTITQNQPSSLLTFKEEMITPCLPAIKDQRNIRVLFKSQANYSSFLAVYAMEPSNSNETQEEFKLEEEGIKIIPSNQHKMINESEQATLSSEPKFKNVKLDLAEYNDHHHFCARAQKLNQFISNRTYIHEIDQEIALWEWQLKQINHQNTINWNTLISSILQHPEDLYVHPNNAFDDEIKRIKEKLLWNTILRYYQQGFSDKTREMLDNYIESQRLMHEQPQKGVNSQARVYETDCKICFCSYNNDSNQVIYCDSCNTSYHLACYGLTAMPEDQQYFCDRCLYKKRQEKLQDCKIRKLYCQICGRINFPMKKIDDHFYHVTCLMLFNLVEFRQERLQLRGSLTHQNILHMVIQNQLSHEECDCCRRSPGCDLGMQFSCGQEGCDNSVHPICAYLSGCRMNIRKTPQKRLAVEVFCNRHGDSRILQTYFRRYMCNLKETCSISIEEFKEKCKKEERSAVEEKRQSLLKKEKYENNILLFSKYLRIYFQTKEKKGVDDIPTESKRMLEKYKHKK